MMRQLPAIRLIFCLTGMCALAHGAGLEVPFDFLHNKIVLEASINGRGTHRFLLDSGTHASTIDLGLARRFGLPLGPAKSEGVGAGRDRILGRQTVCEQLSVGGLTVRNLVVSALDLSKLSL